MDNTVFFGNGLNLLNKDNLTWSKILDRIKGSRKFESNNLPNTMIYDRILLEKHKPNSNFLSTENDIKADISTQLSQIAPVPIFIDLYELPVQHFITTNYDDAFIRSIKLKYEIDVNNLSTEDIYSIRRQKEIIDSNKRETKFWQIHGATDKPASIMLGLDHYCGYVGKLGNYVKGMYKYSHQQKEIAEISMKKKILNNNFSGSSWVELFFTSNIHVLGFSLDFVETDIWWLIDRRARMKKDSELVSNINNKIFFYCIEIDKQKKELLESFDVVVDTYQSNSKKSISYEGHYKKAIVKIKELCQEA